MAPKTVDWQCHAQLFGLETKGAPKAFPVQTGKTQLPPSTRRNIPLGATLERPYLAHSRILQEELKEKAENGIAKGVVTFTKLGNFSDRPS